MKVLRREFLPIASQAKLTKKNAINYRENTICRSIHLDIGNRKKSNR